MIKIQIKRGSKVNLPDLANGEYGITTDTDELFIGGSEGNLQIPLLGADGKLPGVYMPDPTFNELIDKYGFTYSNVKNPDTRERTINVTVKDTCPITAYMTAVISPKNSAGYRHIEIETTIGDVTTSYENDISASGGEGGPIV